MATYASRHMALCVHAFTKRTAWLLDLAALHHCTYVVGRLQYAHAGAQVNACPCMSMHVHAWPRMATRMGLHGYSMHSHACSCMAMHCDAWLHMHRDMTMHAHLSALPRMISLYVRNFLLGILAKSFNRSTPCCLIFLYSQTMFIINIINRPLLLVFCS